MIRSFRFTLRYKVGEHADPDAMIEALGAAGCTDAIIGVGLRGRLALEFDREAVTARAAIDSAMADIAAALPDAVLIEAGPDIVGLSDAAEWLEMTRQNMRKTMVDAQDFPLPLHEGSASLWHFADILDWLSRNRRTVIAPTLIEASQAARAVNDGRARLQRPVETARSPLPA